MSNFKVGDKVLCVETNNSAGFCVGAIAGNEYVIKGIYYCKCGLISFDIGLKNPAHITSTVCRVCRAKTNPIDIWWHASERFVKADEQDNFASEVLEEIAEKIEVEFIELHNTEGNGL